MKSITNRPTTRFSLFRGGWEINVDPRPWIDDPNILVQQEWPGRWTIESTIKFPSSLGGPEGGWPFPEPIRGWITDIRERMRAAGIGSEVRLYRDSRRWYELHVNRNSQDIAMQAFFMACCEGIIRYDSQMMNVAEAVKLLTDTAYGQFTQITDQKWIYSPDDRPVEKDFRDYPWVVVDRDRASCERRVKEFQRLGLWADRRYRRGVQLIVTHPKEIVDHCNEYTPPVILSLDPEHLLRETCIYSDFANLDSARIYAIQSDRTPIDPTLNRRALMLYGPRRYHLEAANQRCVRVRLKRFVPNEPPPKDASGWALKQWLANCSQRNQLIQKLATSEAHGATQIRILAASLNHAVKLLEHLPDAVILASESTDTMDLDDEVIERIQRGEADRGGTEPLTIVTPEGLSRLYAGDLLIRTDGGTCRLEFSYGLVQAVEAGILTVVDLQDDRPPAYHQNARRRVNEYRERGWCVETE